MAAIALRKAGISVEVFERLPQRLQAQGAGLRIVPEMAALLQERAGIDLGPVSTVTRWFRHIGPANRMIANQEIAGQFTSWGSLHRALSLAFGAGQYRLGRNCVGVERSADRAVLRFADGAEEPADLAVFADGILSTGRRLLAPDTPLSYAGYVTWRGFVPAAALSAETRAVLTDAVTYSVMDHSHMIIYPIPDPQGSEPGAILFNFVWYRNVTEGAPLDALMTDREGVRRPISLPAGAVQERFVSQLRAEAAELLPPASVEVVAKSGPFIQALYDVTVRRMAYGRCCLVGDAAFATRPHAGAATTKAAVDSWRLADRLVEAEGDVVVALALWEPEQLAVGAAFVERNRQMGDRSLVANNFNPADSSTLPGLYGPGR